MTTNRQAIGTTFCGILGLVREKKGVCPLETNYDESHKKSTDQGFSSTTASFFTS